VHQRRLRALRAARDHDTIIFDNTPIPIDAIL